MSMMANASTQHLPDADHTRGGSGEFTARHTQVVSDVSMMITVSARESRGSVTSYGPRSPSSIHSSACTTID